MADRTDGSGVLMAFLLGGIVGAGLALLFAPQSGKRTREDIKEFTEKTTDTVRDISEKATKEIGELYEKGRGLVEERVPKKEKEKPKGKSKK